MRVSRQLRPNNSGAWVVFGRLGGSLQRAPATSSSVASLRRGDFWRGLFGGRLAWAPLAALLLGLVLIGWIIGQILLWGEPPILQYLYLTGGGYFRAELDDPPAGRLTCGSPTAAALSREPGELTLDIPVLTAQAGRRCETPVSR